MNNFSAPRCAGGNGRPSHHAVYMRYAGREGAAAVHRCPLCSNKILDGMISGSSNLPAPTFRPDPPTVVEPTTHLSRPIERCPGPHVGPVVGTLAVVGGIVIAGVLISALMSDD